MLMKILDPGPQATLQGVERTGLRDMGVPASGPADRLSHAIANHLAGNPHDTTALEITFGPVTVQIGRDCRIALSGAEATATVNDTEVPFHQTVTVHAGDMLNLGRPAAGLRTYLAVTSGIAADTYLDSTSTYLPAGFGGYQGRALRKGDILQPGNGQTSKEDEFRATPPALRFPLGNAFALRASPGPDGVESDAQLWTETYRATQRASRIGIEIDGVFPELAARESLPSAAVFPGALQIPPQGRGFLLLSDCQTTGGYPHILQVNVSDRHLLGQIRPGDRIHFLKRSPEQAAEDLREKRALIGNWIPDFKL